MISRSSLPHFAPLRPFLFQGIGFITPDEETAGVEGDILVHYMQIRQETEDGFKSLDQGAKVRGWFQVACDALVVPQIFFLTILSIIIYSSPWSRGRRYSNFCGTHSSLRSRH